MLPWAVFLLGLRPVLARNHGCCTLPLFGHRSTIARNYGCYCNALGIIILLKFRPVLAHNINCYITSWTYHYAKSCGNFAPSLPVTTVAAHCPYSDIVPLLPVTMAATAIHNIFFVYGTFCLPQQDFTIKSFDVLRNIVVLLNLCGTVL